MKKIATIFILCCMFASMFSICAFAQDSYGVMPCYDNISDATIEISFNGNTGKVTGIARKMTGATSLEGVLDVYEENNGQWVLVGSWSNSTTRRALSVTGEFDAVSNRTYKAIFTVVAYGTTTETVTVEAYKLCN